MVHDLTPDKVYSLLTLIVPVACSEYTFCDFGRQVYTLIKESAGPKVCLSVRTPLKAGEKKADSPLVQAADISVVQADTHQNQTPEDQDSEEAIFKGTQAMYDAETEKFEERWRKKFNKTIQTFQEAQARCTWWRCCSSSWGLDPFVQTMQMSVTDHWNDIYLAHAYPFLYARKLHYAFANHWWERFLLAYGKMGLHIFVLIFLTLVIVGGYRNLARCDRFAPTNSTLGVFATQVRPQSSMPLTGN